MTRLVTFGCSYPYGHGLKDCYNSKDKGYGPTPSNFAFPGLIAQHCNFQDVNLSRPGISNKGIVHKIMQFDFVKGDICLLAWTHVDRTSQITKDDDIVFIGPWQTDSLSKSYYKYFYEHYDNLWNTKLYINYANLYLKNKGVQVINIQGYNASEHIEWKELVDKDMIMTYENVHSEPLDRALDNAHPGEKTHKRFAEYMLVRYGYILRKNKVEN